MNAFNIPNEGDRASIIQGNFIQTQVAQPKSEIITKALSLDKYSLKQLDAAWAKLPADNPTKPIIGAEIESRVDAMLTKSIDDSPEHWDKEDLTEAIEKSVGQEDDMSLEKALEILSL